MPKKNRSSRETPILHLLIWVTLICLLIYLWKVLRCPGIPSCYLCNTFTPDIILNPLAMSSSDDFSQLMNLHNFTFLINNRACNHTDVLLLVLVHSDPYNYDKRSTIRSTWGRIISDRFRVLFLLGLPNSTVVQKQIEEENDANRDIVMGNFADTYRNLTYKHVMALKWMKYFCPNARYLLKTDDDVFVNSPSFLHYVSDGVPKTKLMRCLPVYEGLAKRTWRSKWRVSWSEYKFRLYPPFCQGFAILYSPDVVAALYTKAQTADYFWIDDVFITGFLGLSAKFAPSTFGKYMLEPQDLDRAIDCDGFAYLLGPWNLGVVDIRKLWDKASRADYVKVEGNS